MPAQSGNNLSISQIKDGLINPNFTTPLYVSANSFTVAGDVTSWLRPGRGVVLTFQTAGIRRCIVVSLSYDSGTNKTTINVTGDSLTNETITEALLSFSDLEATKNYVDSGWNSIDETWTYASATTVTVPGDKTGKYSAGMKVRLVQSSTTKYFYIIKATYSAPNTTITLYGGTDYSVANSAISNIFFSNSESPYGFPAYFNDTSGGKENGKVWFEGQRMVVTGNFRYSAVGANWHVTGWKRFPVVFSTIIKAGAYPVCHDPAPFLYTAQVQLSEMGNSATKVIYKKNQSDGNFTFFWEVVGKL